MRRLLLIIIFFQFAIIPVAVEAQFNQVQTNDGFRMVVTPDNPSANAVVTARIIDQLRLQPIASITWVVDGEVRDEFADQQTLQLLTGDIGDTITIAATVRLLAGKALQFSETITTSRLDLLVEASTITPPHYTGRAIPSLGSTIRVTALPFANEGATDPAAYTYRWRVNDQPVTGQQRSANQIIIPTNFDRRINVEVEVIRPNNTILTTGSTSIEPSEPELIYYEVHPLRGLLPVALDEQYILTNNEVLLRAEPYFMSQTLLSSAPRIAWQLNGQTINNPNTDPYEIILRRQNDSGSFTLATEVSNPNRLLQHAEAELQVRF
jgi:hypothetical protein